MLSAQPTPEEVRIGRLQKRIKKLTAQRDHYKEEYSRMVDILKHFPIYERRHKEYLELYNEKLKIKKLESRVWEQEQLLARFRKENET